MNKLMRSAEPIGRDRPPADRGWERGRHLGDAGNDEDALRDEVLRFWR